MHTTKSRAFSSEKHPHFLRPRSELQNHLDWQRKTLIFQQGEYFDSYLASEPGRKEFWLSNGEGFISYARRGSYILVGGGLIAPDEHKAQLVKEFVTFARFRKYRIAFHNIGEHELPLFREQGFEVTKWGEEPIVDLGNLDWKGKAYEWVRRQTNYCLRNGVQAFEVPHTELTAEQWKRTLDEMLEIAAESLEEKPQRGEMRFFEGRIGEHEVGQRRVFLARSSEGLGRIEGFVVCTPMRGGTRWATELYRRRKDAVRGTMAYLFHFIQQQMQREGVEQVNLCLEPGLRCSEKLRGDSALVRLGLTWGGSLMGCVFDVAGLRHFKSRFRPRYESRYVCAYPKVTLNSLLAFVQVSGLFDVDVWKLLKISIDRVRKFAARSTLAKVE
jgi:phosphatidylglycerol lysyltransferase